MTYERMSHRVTAERLTQQWHWVTPKGDRVTANEGDYQVTDPESRESWSIAADAFAVGYRHVGGDTYESQGNVHARHIARDSPLEVVLSSEGPERALPGDWIVTDGAGNKWVVGEMFFHANYHPVNDARTTT